MRTDQIDAVHRTRRLAVLVVVLAALTIGFAGSAAALAGRDAVFAGSEPDEGSEEPEPVPEEDAPKEDAPQPTESDGDGDAPHEATDESAPEPGDVPIGVWIAAGLVVLVAVVWSLTNAGKDGASTGAVD